MEHPRLTEVGRAAQAVPVGEAGVTFDEAERTSRRLVETEVADPD